ncbi:hypothetical protein GCM10027028_49610 [Streptomyces sundarbansensis]
MLGYRGALGLALASGDDPIGLELPDGFAERSVAEHGAQRAVVMTGGRLLHLPLRSATRGTG